MTLEVRQFRQENGDTPNDIGEQIDSFLKANPGFAVAHMAQITVESAENSGVFVPAVITFFATEDDATFQLRQIAPTTPTTLPQPAAEIDIDEIIAEIPCGSPTVAGLVRTSQEPVTEGVCPIVVTTDDPILVAGKKKSFVIDPGSGVSSATIGDTVVYILPNNLNRTIIGHLFVPAGSFSGTPTIKFVVAIQSTGGGNGDVDFTLSLRYLETGDTLDQAYSETINKIFPVINNLNEISVATFNLDPELVIDGGMLSFTLQRSGGSVDDSFTGAIGIAMTAEAGF